MAISIFKFLSRYYGILLDINIQYSHKELKKDFYFLERCSFEYAESHPYLIACGKIIYVYDNFNNVVPYFCPCERIVFDDMCECSCEKNNTENVDLLIECLSELPTYMVKELLGRYKDRPSFYKIIKGELIKRGVYKNKKYKIGREINKMELEESELYDKCKRRRKIKYNQP